MDSQGFGEVSSHGVAKRYVAMCVCSVAIPNAYH